MSIITLRKVSVFSVGKELYESILFFAKLWLSVSVVPHISPSSKVFILLYILSDIVNFNSYQ